MRVGGECSSTLYTVRRRVVKSSLWKQMTTLVDGRSCVGGYSKDGQLWGGGREVWHTSTEVPSGVGCGIFSSNTHVVGVAQSSAAHNCQTVC